MLDIKIIKNDPESVKEAMHNRNINVDLKIDKLLETDKKRRNSIVEMETMKARQNAVNKQIPVLKSNGQDIRDLLTEMKELSNKISKESTQITALEKEQRETLLSIPNIPNKDVPVGKDDTANIEIRRWGEQTAFDFEPLSHWDIGKKLNLFDAERAAKVTGARFHFYRGLGARLERSLVNFFLNTHIDNGYTEILPPFIVNRSSMIGTGQLPKFEEDSFKLTGEDFFLISTAEVPVTNMHRDEIIKGKDLPYNYCAYSACFRAEAGAAGRDTRGLIRQHQFNKVELVKFTKPEESYNELERITQEAEKLLQMLKLPYRVVLLSTGDLGFSAAKTYDIEVWMPSYGRYLEISSCSNFEDYQARRAGIRYKEKIQNKASFVHTLNGSGLAVGRTVAAILENYQRKDGDVDIPEVLQDLMSCSKIARTTE